MSCMAGAIVGLVKLLITGILGHYLLFGLFFKPPLVQKLFTIFTRPFISITSPIASLFLSGWGERFLTHTIHFGTIKSYGASHLSHFELLILGFFCTFVTTGLLTSVILIFSNTFSTNFRGTIFRVFSFAFCSGLVQIGGIYLARM